MKKIAIDFLKSKAWFIIWLLLIICVGELSDKLDYYSEWHITKFLNFIAYYYLFFFCWLILYLIKGFQKESDQL